MAATSRTTGVVLERERGGIGDLDEEALLEAEGLGALDLGGGRRRGGEAGANGEDREDGAAAGRLRTFVFGRIGGISFPGRNTGPILHHFRRKGAP